MARRQINPLSIHAKAAPLMPLLVLIKRWRASKQQMQLHNAFAQHLVFPGKQILRELVTTLVRVVRRAGKVMIDS